MRTLSPGPGFYELEWSKEFTCSGRGHSGKGCGCGAELVVDWEDLFLTTLSGDPREIIRNPTSPKNRAEFTKLLEAAITRGPGNPNPRDAVFVSFRCHICGIVTDIITMSHWDVGPQGFYLLLTRQEWDKRMAPFRKDVSSSKNG